MSRGKRLVEKGRDGGSREVDEGWSVPESQIEGLRTWSSGGAWRPSSSLKRLGQEGKSLLGFPHRGQKIVGYTLSRLGSRLRVYQQCTAIRECNKRWA